MYKYVSILRPRRWVKNLLIFLPIFFALDLLEYGVLSRVLLGFAFFCLLSSCTYIVNDLFDKQKDLCYADKDDRPIICGDIGSTPATIIAAVLGVVGIIGAFFLSAEFGLVLLAYLVLSLWYSAWLQHVAIVDILALDVSAVLRVAGGAIVIGIAVSPWLMLVAFLGVHMYILGRRIYQKKKFKVGAKALLARYPENFLRSSLTASVAIFSVVYLLFALISPYAVSFEGNLFFYSGIFILYIALRYAFVVLTKNEKNWLKADASTAIASLAYVCYVVVIFYAL